MFKGRIGRLAYFLGWVYLLIPVLVLLVIVLGVSGFTKGAHAGPNPAVSIVLIISLILDVAWLIFYLIAGFGLIIRRWHDLNQSGWLALLQLIPLVSIVCSLIQLFAPGTNGSNNYGDQANPSLEFKTVLMGSRDAGAASSDPHFAAVQTPTPAASDPAVSPASPPPIQPQTVQPTPPTPTTPTPPAAPAPEQSSSGSEQPPT